jgi:hypothetical protein
MLSAGMLPLLLQSLVMRDAAYVEHTSCCSRQSTVLDFRAAACVND